MSHGDGFKLQVETCQPRYLYILNIDGADRITWLFPLERYQYPLPPKSRWIPSKEYWYELDATKGEEVVVILSTVTPDHYLEEQRQRVEASKNADAEERWKLKDEIMSHIEYRQAEGDTLERLSFHHQ